MAGERTLCFRAWPARRAATAARRPSRSQSSRSEAGTRAVGAGRPAAEAQRINVTAAEEGAIAGGQAQAVGRGPQKEGLGDLGDPAPTRAEEGAPRTPGRKRNDKSPPRSGRARVVEGATDERDGGEQPVVVVRPWGGECVSPHRSGVEIFAAKAAREGCREGLARRRTSEAVNGVRIQPGEEIGQQQGGTQTRVTGSLRGRSGPGGPRPVGAESCRPAVPETGGGQSVAGLGPETPQRRIHPTACRRRQTAARHRRG